MLLKNYYMDKLFNLFFGDRSRFLIEKYIINISIISFLLHLILIIISKYQFISLEGELFNNPLAAIYTPFSFILVYEVYLLIFYLPQSFTYCLSKQFEIITLIVFRRFFKDISNLDLSIGNITIFENIDIFYDLVASLILFLLVFYFKKNVKRKNIKDENISSDLKTFIYRKKALSIALFPIFIYMALTSFANWSNDFISNNYMTTSSNINHIFFEDFFTFLIFIDVIILLLSFYFKNNFHKIIRNSGFIVSTIIIRISFALTGIMNLALLVTSLLIGIIVLKIHNMFVNENISIESQKT